MKKSVKYLALLIWVAAFTIVCTESAARLTFKTLSRIPFAGELEWDDKVGWRGKRGFEGKVRHGKVPDLVFVSINQDGFRDDDWDAKLAAAARTRSTKILVMGDSIAYGLGAEREDRLSDQLEREFLRQGEKVTVFNAAIPAYSPSQEYRLLPELLARLSPDGVLLVLCGNDYGDVALPYDHRTPIRVYKPFYDTRGNLVLNESVPRRPSLWVKGTFLERLHLFYFVDQVTYRLEDMAYRKHGILTRRDTRIHELDTFIETPDLLTRFPYVERTMIALLEKMRETVEKDDRRFYVLSTQSSFEELLFPKLSPGVRRIASADTRGIDPERLRIPVDGHPNKLWSEIFARHVRSFISADWKGDRVARYRKN